MQIRLRFKPGAEFETVDQVSPLAQTLSLLRDSFLTDDELCENLVLRGAGHLLPELIFAIKAYKDRGLIDYLISVDNVSLATVVPTDCDFTLSLAPLSPGSKYQFSRFACLRRHSCDLVLESALFDARVVIKQRAGADVIATLVMPCSLEDAIEHLPGVPASHIAAWMELLAGLKAIDACDKPENPSLLTWEFHDAFFHHATRSESLIQPTGATCRFRGTQPALPALKPDLPWEVVELAPPAQDAADLGVSFWEVLERRRSIRVHAGGLLPCHALFEFLYRVASIRKIKAGSGLDTIFRRYPAAGALDEIEFYVVANRCDNLARGLYYYNSARHELARSPATDEHVQSLLANVTRSWRRSEPPQALVILASRFGRIAWGYERIAYRLTLLNAGVIIQTMYLVATAMGLAPCAIGWGDSRLFACATGIDALEEGAIAEFALGLPG